MNHDLLTSLFAVDGVAALFATTASFCILLFTQPKIAGKWLGLAEEIKTISSENFGNLDLTAMSETRLQKLIDAALFAQDLEKAERISTVLIHKVTVE